MKFIKIKNNGDERITLANAISDLLLSQYRNNLYVSEESNHNKITKDFVKKINEMYDLLDNNIRNWYEIIDENQTPLFSWVLMHDEYSENWNKEDEEDQKDPKTRSGPERPGAGPS